jgi:hypothetical protein
MDISMSELDNISLQYFSNRGQYNSLMKKNTINTDKSYLVDKKFYKKRVLDLTKKAFRNEIQDNHVTSLFDNYVMACINYLKFTDKTEIYQEQYDDIIQEEISCEKEGIVDSSYDACDYLICKPEDVKTLNLDTFVKKKTVPVKPMVMPTKAETNIKTPEYKIKGILHRKKPKKS